MSLEEFLAAYGWGEPFASAFAALDNDEPGVYAVARVVSEERGHFRLQADFERSFWGELPGRVRHESRSRQDYPSTGDWVAFRYESSRDRGLIECVLPRRSCLMRKAAGSDEEGLGFEQILASNVDTAFLVTSLNGDLNPRRLERYLTLAWNGGVAPVVLLTKSDLVDDAEARIEQIRAALPGVDVLAVSAVDGQGLPSLDAYLRPGKTCVLLGSSGVGKSTLANRLLGSEVLRTQEIRAADDKGRHTTTSRNLVRLPSGALLIDTPGLRELQLWDDDEGLAKLFADIEEMATRCRFSDCGHESEPGCAIKAALASGTLTEERLASYHKLGKELAAQRRRVDKAEASRSRKGWAKIHTQMREHVKFKKRGGS